MIVNRYVGIRKYVMRGRLARKLIYCILKPKIKKKAKRIINNNELFSQVEIETINRCNGLCPFCPVNANETQRPYALMTDELFHSIIDQLGELNYNGTLGLFSNNEPLLDKRLTSFAQYAKTKVPSAKIQIFTNGTLLTVDKLKEIEPYLDLIVVDNYNDNLELNECIKPIAKLCEEDEKLNQKVQIHLRKINEVLYTRGGQAPNNDSKKKFNMPCILPCEQLIIRPDGKVSLCCNDALGKYTLGDCNNQSIKDIWYSDRMKAIRTRVSQSRDNIELCKYCDTFSL